jgi:hypothetical protein
MVTFSPVTTERTDASRLARLEQKIRSALPDAYRQFLLQHNGGKPDRRIFSFVENGRESTDAVRCFYADCDHTLYSIDKKMQVYSGRIPDGCLPIACDPFGNQLLLSVAADDYGVIYFWDHERESSRAGGKDSLCLLASSFEEFVESLKERQWGS